MGKNVWRKSRYPLQISNSQTTYLCTNNTSLISVHCTYPIFRFAYDDILQNPVLHCLRMLYHVSVVEFNWLTQQFLTFFYNFQLCQSNIVPELLFLKCYLTFFFLVNIGMFAIRAERDYTIDEDFMKAVRKIADAKKLETKLDYKPV